LRSLVFLFVLPPFPQLRVGRSHPLKMTTWHLTVTAMHLIVTAWHFTLTAWPLPGRAWQQFRNQQINHQRGWFLVRAKQERLFLKSWIQGG